MTGPAYEISLFRIFRLFRILRALSVRRPGACKEPI